MIEAECRLFQDFERLKRPIIILKRETYLKIFIRFL